MMRVLVAFCQPPLPEGSAQGRCAIALVRGLRARGVEVTALAASWRDGDGDPPADLGVEVHSVEPCHGPRATLRNLRRPKSHLAASSFGDRVRELSSDADIVHLDEAQAGWCESGSTPSVVHFHHLHALDRPLPKPWHPRFLLELEQSRADRLVARRHSFLIGSSPVVAAALRRMSPRAVVAEAPLALDPSHYEQAPLNGPPVAGVIGLASWGPTRLAMERAVVDVWPLVRRRMPDAVLRVAGRGTEALDLRAPGVEVIGPVDSGADFLRGLSVLLYPVPRGSGVKVKVLEALATGVPVVTTRHGSEGVDGEGGVIVEEDDELIAEATACVLADGDERRARGREARRAFELRHSPEAAAEPLIALYETIVASRGVM